MTYRAYGNDKVTISGGKTVAISEFEAAADDRIQAGVADKVKKIKLADYGIPAPKIRISGHSTQEMVVEGEGNTSSVYANGERMNIARYPNVEDGYMTVSSVVAGGRDDSEYYNTNMSFRVADERAESWTDISDAWVFGFWYWDWSDLTAPVASISDKTITTSIPSPYGIRSGQRFYIYNLLEELDAPGEWYYDKSNDNFYFYPPTDCTEVTLAFGDGSVIGLKEADSMSFLGLNIENAAYNGFSSSDSDYLIIKDCTIRNTGENGLSIDGQNASITENTIYNTGKTGISVTGGDITTLAGSGHNIAKNTIHDVSQMTKRYAPNILINGVGTKVIDNVIYNAPHSGIIYGGNDHIISGNEIYNVVTDASDSGAIYLGQSQITRGTVIKNNYIHDIVSGVEGEIYGVYFDGCQSGDTVTNNRFENIDGYGVFINGGRDNDVTGNSFENITISAVRLSNAGMTSWYESDEVFIETMGLNKGLHTTESYAKYKNLSNILSDSCREPKYNVITGNTFTGCAKDILVEVFDGVSSVDYIKSINTIQQ